MPIIVEVFLQSLIGIFISMFAVAALACIAFIINEILGRTVIEEKWMPVAIGLVSPTIIVGMLWSHDNYKVATTFGIVFLLLIVGVVYLKYKETR